MSKCVICNSRKGDRECPMHASKLCSRCCGGNRSWKNCPTTCKYFKEEDYPGMDLHIYEMSLKNEDSGEISKGKENCFLPNVYDLIDCTISNLEFKFLNSHTLAISISLILESHRNLKDEIYLKDPWKNEENWGPYTDLYNLSPLLFTFGGENSKFLPLNTSVTIDGHEVDFKESHVHWNIGMPFSTIKYHKKPIFDKDGKKINYTPFISGKSFSGNNQAIFSQFELNRQINIKITLAYQKLSLDKSNMEIKFPFSILIPFKNIRIENIDIIPPVDFQVKNPFIKIITPRNSIPMDRSPIMPPIDYSIKHGAVESRDFSADFNINDYKMFKIDFSLFPEVKCESSAYITSYPLPSSIYNSINKLYNEKFAPAKLIISNFSDTTIKASVISEIQELSNIFEKDVIIGPFKEEEVRIIPILNQNEVKKLHTPLNTSLSIKVISKGSTIFRSNEPLEFLARDTMIWEVEDPGRSGGIDLSDLVVSWVTPSIPEVDDILSKAAKLGGSLGSFSNDIELTNEVKAIYDTISNDMRYVNRSFTHGGNATVIIQRILSPRQTINGGSGNCIDLSVLFASCLESCGINPIIILTQNHAFVGWEGFSSENFLEATFLGRYNFESATSKGNEQYTEFSKGPNQPGKRRIDVKAIRSKGVYPPTWF